MYVGRIVAIGCAKSGHVAALYRVSSRSFPNRRAKVLGDKVAVVPKPGFETDIFKNPYIAYNCLRLAGDYAVATNGSHTDPIAEKLATGMGVRDALVTVLSALDYEHDSLNTPRIAAIIRHGADSGFLGIVRHDALLVQEFRVLPGQAFYLCTYEHNSPSLNYTDDAFEATSAAEACAYVLAKGAFAQLEKPVTAACAVAKSSGGFDIAVADAPAP